MDNLIIDYNNIYDLILQKVIKYYNKNLTILKDVKNLTIKIKEIEILDCKYKEIKYLDITELINLKKLYCNENQLQEPMDFIHRLKACLHALN